MNEEKIKLKEDLEKEYSISNLQKVIEYCKKNIEYMDMNDDIDFYLCHATNFHLMKNKLGRFDKQEAKFLTISFAKLGCKLLKIKEKTNIKIMPKEEYSKKMGDEGRALNTLKKDNTHLIIYSEKVCDELMTSDLGVFLGSLQTILHEVVHSFQTEKIQSDYNKLNAVQAKNIYIMGMEKIVRKLNPEFYKKNYEFLLGENDAEKNGLICVMHILKVYNRNLYDFLDKDVIEERIEKYDNIINEEAKDIFGIKIDKSKNLMFMEFITREVLKKRPELLFEYPALEVAYNKDGTSKSILELLEDRKLRLERSKGLENDSISDINKLFSTIINNRDMSKEEKIEEILKLEEYIISNNIQDEYIFDLLNTRLQRSGFKIDFIEERIQSIRNNIAEKYKTDEKYSLKEDLKSYTYSDNEYRENIEKSKENSEKEALSNEEKDNMKIE